MRGFFIAATIVLLFSLLIFSLQQAPSQPSFAGGLTKADALASDVAFGMRPLLPETRHTAGSEASAGASTGAGGKEGAAATLVLKDTMPDSSAAERFASYSSLASNLSQLLNAEISLGTSPQLLVGDSLSYKYDSYSKEMLEIEQLGEGGGGQPLLVIKLSETCANCTSGGWRWSSSGARFSISVMDGSGNEVFPASKSGSLAAGSSNSATFSLGNGSSLLIRSDGAKLTIIPQRTKISTELSLEEGEGQQPVFLVAKVAAGGQETEKLRVG